MFDKEDALKYLVDNRNFMSNTDMFYILLEVIESNDKFFEKCYLDKLLNENIC